MEVAPKSGISKKLVLNGMGAKIKKPWIVIEVEGSALYPIPGNNGNGSREPILKVVNPRKRTITKRRIRFGTERKRLLISCFFKVNYL